MSDFDWTYDIKYPEFEKGEIVLVLVSTTGYGYAIMSKVQVWVTRGEDGYR
jgi:hypothetical protein